MTKTKEAIRLFLDRTCWAVDYACTSQAQAIRDAFGSTIVPLPYTPLMAAERVQESVQHLNPNFIVVRISGGAR